MLCKIDKSKENWRKSRYQYLENDAKPEMTLQEIPNSTTP